MSSSKPQQVAVTVFNVGFGDTFLLTFSYKGGERRHMLVDFGSKSLPDGAGEGYTKKVAEQIRKACGGKLDVVVATHRHQDHISGFATNKDGTGSGDIIRRCSPKLVLQPWTERLDADPSGSPALADTVAHFKQSVLSMQRVAESLAAELSEEPEALRMTAAHRLLRFKGENAVKNKSAVLNLSTMGECLYLERGKKVDIEAVLPGVKITVLGPPAQKDAADLSYAEDSSQYWMRIRKAWTALENGSGPKKRTLKTRDIPLEARWFVKAADRAHREDAMHIVTALDDFINNTSLILLIEAAGKKILLPGDAQLESWEYALKSTANRTALKNVDLYKVGHHGSRNATPKQLWELFAKKKAKKLITILSTKNDVFNEKYEVPRKALVDELEKNSTVHDTRDLEGMCEKEPIIL